MLGQYEILSPLGVGGMGEVYRARDSRLDREVAVKVLPELMSVEQDRLVRFEQEARAAAALNHPNILVVHDIGKDNGRAYVVAELLEGKTLRDVLNEGAPAVAKAVEYATQIAQDLLIPTGCDPGTAEPDNVVENKPDSPRSSRVVNRCCEDAFVAGRQGFEPR